MEIERKGGGFYLRVRSQKLAAARTADRQTKHFRIPQLRGDVGECDVGDGDVRVGDVRAAAPAEDAETLGDQQAAPFRL